MTDGRRVVVRALLLSVMVGCEPSVPLKQLGAQSDAGARAPSNEEVHALEVEPRRVAFDFERQCKREKVTVHLTNSTSRPLRLGRVWWHGGEGPGPGWQIEANWEPGTVVDPRQTKEVVVRPGTEAELVETQLIVEVDSSTVGVEVSATSFVTVFRAVRLWTPLPHQTTVDSIPLPLPHLKAYTLVETVLLGRPFGDLPDAWIATDVLDADGALLFTDGGYLDVGGFTLLMTADIDNFPPSPPREGHPAPALLQISQNWRFGDWDEITPVDETIELGFRYMARCRYR